MSLSSNLYTVSQQKILLLVGLGNTSKQYKLSRHNVGFIVLDAFVNSNEQMSEWLEKKDLKCHLSQGRFGDTLVIAIKPTTDMNLSGESVSNVKRFYKIDTHNILVIHDELDLQFGQIRMRQGGSSAGHNGIKSISNLIGENYGRLRIGIGPKKPTKMDSADFVLQSFNINEKSLFLNLNQEVNVILIEYIYGGQLIHETRSFIV